MNDFINVRMGVQDRHLLLSLLSIYLPPRQFVICDLCSFDPICVDTDMMIHDHCPANLSQRRHPLELLDFNVLFRFMFLNLHVIF